MGDDRNGGSDNFSIGDKVTEGNSTGTELGGNGSVREFLVGAMVVGIIGVGDDCV